MGLLATYVPTPGKTELAAFKGRVVYIHEDNDRAGREKAKRLAKCLKDIASKVTVVRYPDVGDGGDVSDWLDKGNDLEALLKRCAEVEAGGAKPYVSRCVANVEKVHFKWFWPGQIAFGKPVIVAGVPGLGKSQLTALQAAVATTAGTWPDGTKCADRCTVIFVACEDDVADTVRPRLEAAGADIKRVHVLDYVRTFDEDGHEQLRLFDLSQDLDVLRRMIEDVGAQVVIIDPVSAYLGSVDSHKTSDVRALLAPLQTLAAELRVAIILVSHLTKSSGDGTAMSRVTGSNAFVAASRGTFLVARDPEDEDDRRRILSTIKNNIGDDDQKAFTFEIEGVDLDEGRIKTSRVKFLGEVQVDVNDLVKQRESTSEERGAVAEAMEFLRVVLADGPKAVTWIHGEAKKLDISIDGALKRAKARMKVRADKSGQTGNWVWCMPAQVANPECGEGGARRASRGASASWTRKVCSPCSPSSKYGLFRCSPCPPRRARGATRATRARPGCGCSSCCSP